MPKLKPLCLKLGRAVAWPFCHPVQFLNAVADRLVGMDDYFGLSDSPHSPR